MTTASERKKRFLAEKEAAGGAEKLIEQQKSRPWRVYFNDEGEITCFTNNESVAVDPEWKTYEFTQEQVAVLKGKNLTNFRVRVDPLVDNLYSIEVKPQETHKLDVENDFLAEITSGNKTQYADIVCKVTEDALRISMSKKTKDLYADIYPISATKNGQRILKFFITAPKDPHIVFDYLTVSIADLIINNEVVKETHADFREYGLYTLKLYDSYKRT